MFSVCVKFKGVGVVTGRVENQYWGIVGGGWGVGGEASYN